MIDGYYERIAFVLFKLGVHWSYTDPVPADPWFIKKSIQTLMADGMTKDQIRAAAVREACVIIREDLFPEEV